MDKYLQIKNDTSNAKDVLEVIENILSSGSISVREPRYYGAITINEDHTIVIRGTVFHLPQRIRLNIKAALEDLKEHMRGILKEYNDMLEAVEALLNGKYDD